MPRPYDKLPLTFDEQLARVAERGLVIDDREQFFRFLATTGYYRLSAYWHPFRVRDRGGNITDALEPGVTSSTVIGLYEFDHRLRLAVMDAIERVEVAIRTRLTYQFSHAHGTFGHIHQANFHRGFWPGHKKWMEDVTEEILRSREDFIRHYQTIYTGFPEVLPLWMVTEVMSLGQLSRFYTGLLHEDKKPIADWHHIHYQKLGNWLHVLTYVRNICAHHGRLWNRELAIRPDSQSRNPLWRPPWTSRTDRIAIVLLMLRHLLVAISTGREWQEHCTRLLDPWAANPRWRDAMGLPEGWRDHPLWIRPDGVDATP